jgi:hypothetical protein
VTDEVEKELDELTAGKKKARKKVEVVVEEAPAVTQEVTDEPTTVIISEVKAPEAPKLSAQTLAEMEAGRAHLKRFQ